MRNRNYALLWSGQLVSEMGNRFHWIAVSLWVYSLTNSAAAISLAISSMFVGGLLVSLWAGVLVDRFDRRRILIVADLVRAVLVLAIPSLIQVNIWLVYLDLALISVATAFFRPASFAVIPATVPRSSLLTANSLFSAMDTGTEMVGPFLAGLLAEAVGYAPLLYLDAGTYAFSALCVGLMTVTPVSQTGLTGLKHRSLWEGVTEGLRYIRRDSLQWGLFILIVPATLVGSGLNALQTPLAKGVIGLTDAQFGTFNSVWGVGFLVASILLGWYGAILGRGTLIFVGYFLGFAATALMALSANFQHLLITAFAVGFSNTMYYVGLGTILMEHTPSAFRGRVISTRQLAIALVRVAAPLAFGTLAERVGVRDAILAMAITGAVGTGAVILGSDELRKLARSTREPLRRPFGLWIVAIGSVDPEIEHPRQHRMNGVSSVVMLLVLGYLVYWLRVYAIVLLAFLMAFAYLGSRIKRRWGV
jgi:MFS family permease